MCVLSGHAGNLKLWEECSFDGQQHVNNVTYSRYAETARMNWAWNYAVHIDPEHKKEWSELWTSKGDGLILKSIRTDYKFVSPPLCVVTVYYC